MNDLIRPPLYNAFHFIWPAKYQHKASSLSVREENETMPGLETVESSARSAKGRISSRRAGHCRLSSAATCEYLHGRRIRPDDGQQLQCPRPSAEVLVDGDKFTVIRKRETYEDMVALEK